MTRGSVLALVAGSALVGGIAGAGVSRLITGPSAPPADSAKAKLEAETAGAGDDALSARVDALEQSVRSLERRMEPMLRALSAAAMSSGTPEHPRPEGKSIVDDPVFEAAVIDVMERASEMRSAERDRRREERRKEDVERWATDLTQRLGLSASQRATVLEIRNDAMNEMQRAFGGADGGGDVPRDQRRARSEALRADSEAKLSKTLDSRQQAEYEKLEPGLKIGRGLRGR